MADNRDAKIKRDPPGRIDTKAVEGALGDTSEHFCGWMRPSVEMNDTAMLMRENEEDAENAELLEAFEA